MRNLLNFVLKYGHWFLFLLLEIASFLLLFRFNHFQGSVGFTSSNRVMGRIYAVSAEVSSFFQLNSANTQLTHRNLELQIENQLLREALSQRSNNEALDRIVASSPDKDYTIIPATIINNSLNRPDNYITLDKGSADGVTPEMGVVNGNGIVGIIYLTSEHYSLAISLLNSKSSLSCKFKNNEYFGYLKWRGTDARFAYLEDVPRHALFQKGDTIVTSGYSAVFPKGLMVGRVDSIADSKDGLSYLLRIQLATDFACLDDALIISGKNRQKQHTLEHSANQHTKK
jgi:rod shape-determining protein MreC